MKIFIELISVLGLYISLSFLFLDSVFAKIEVSDPPTKIEVNKEFELNVSVSNLNDPVHFLGIALHKKSGDSYFGQTKNGDNWIEADDVNCKNFPQASIVEGSWSGKLVGNFFYDEKDFDNSLGSYILKVIKYTDSCNKSFSEDIIVDLFDSNPRPPTAIPTNIPTNPPKPTPTPKPPTSAKNPTQIPTSYIAKQIIPTAQNIKSVVSVTENTLGAETTSYPLVSSVPTTIPTIIASVKTKNQKNNSAKILLGLGGALILGSGVWIGIIKRQKF